VYLMDLESEMTDSVLAQFEMTTLQFIRDTQGSTPDFTLDILAVTVLTQSMKTPKPEESVGELGIQVAFRTTGVVTEGVAPLYFDFDNVTNTGFKNYYGEFLYRLTMADEFFHPLADHVGSTTLIPLPQAPRTTKSRQGQFVAAIVCATLALILAMVVAMYAVRKHIRNEQNKLQQLEYPANTGTMSDGKDEECPYDDELSDMSATATGIYAHKKYHGPSGRTLQMKIDDDKIEMEDVGLTPVSKPPLHRTSLSSFNRPPRVPIYSPTGGERRQSGTINDLKRASFGSAFGMKKWLTPRNSTPNKKSAIDLNGPPDSEIDFQVIGNTQKSTTRRSLDPDAVKASTKNIAGTFSDENTIQGASFQTKAKNDATSMFSGNTPLSIPVGFFGRNSDNHSDATSNNVDRISEGSAATSFFTKLAGQKNSVFTGNWSTASQPPEAGNKLSNKIGSTSVGNKNSLNEQNLAQLQTNSNENVEATIIETSSTFEEKLSYFERGSSFSQQARDAIIARTKQQIVAQKVSSTAVDAMESKRRRTFEADSVYSEQSELDLNDFGVEASLGAFPPKTFENDARNPRDSSFAGHEYGSRPNGAPSQVSEGAQSLFSVPSVSSVSRSHLAEEREKRRISLNTLIKQKDTYDVFAPPGPIGIVVDTSKVGPAVHSLKSSSPMLGLINAGDLIVALDGEDTRSMTAASLTRLMAKKSRQKERKITLVSPDGM
jgi:hypothetical protein